MEVRYRKSFLRDLKRLKLKKHPLYDKVYALSFETLPNAQSLATIPDTKAMRGHPGRYRIRLGSYRMGIQVDGSVVELVRVLDRREFFRYSMDCQIVLQEFREGLWRLGPVRVPTFGYLLLEGH